MAIEIAPILISPERNLPMIGTSFAERSNATVRRLLVAAGAVCAAQMAAVVGADATDLRQPAAAEPAVTAPAWTGAYVDQFAGYGWGRARATAPFDANTGFFFNWTGNPYSFSPDGFFSGATLGYNWQSGALVFGPEAEYAYFDFGRIRTAGTSSEPGELFRQRIDVTAHTVNIGIHYLFRATPTVAE